MKDTPKIVCPVCGSEYLPVEVFIPDDFFGKPVEIMRNEAGKIDFVLGEGMNLTETYVCDNCNTQLKINTEISFNTEVDTKETFEEEYVSSFTKPKKIHLEEIDLFEE